MPVLERMHHRAASRSPTCSPTPATPTASPRHWALPIRALGADLIHDLHPNDRGPHGTHHGAICANGNLYCPATPTTLLELGPLPRGASAEQTASHDQQCAELAHYKLSPITRHDPDGYHRVTCPAAQGKLRCPLQTRLDDPARTTAPRSSTRPSTHPPAANNKRSPCQPQ